MKSLRTATIAEPQADKVRVSEMPAHLQNAVLADLAKWFRHHDGLMWTIELVDSGYPLEDVIDLLKLGWIKRSGIRQTGFMPAGCLAEFISQQKGTKA